MYNSRIAIVGNGFVGSILRRDFPNAKVFVPSQRITNHQTVGDAAAELDQWMIGQKPFDVIVNTIAVTYKSKCEQHVGMTACVNTLWPSAMYKEIAARTTTDNKTGTRFKKPHIVHLSTACVYPWNYQLGAYINDAEACSSVTPFASTLLNEKSDIYLRSKSAADLFLTEACQDEHSIGLTILRPRLIFGSGGKAIDDHPSNFISRIAPYTNNLSPFANSFTSDKLITAVISTLANDGSPNGIQVFDVVHSWAASIEYFADLAGLNVPGPSDPSRFDNSKNIIRYPRPLLEKYSDLQSIIAKPLNKLFK